MLKNMYLLLGMPEGASIAEVTKGYTSLMQSLNDDQICCECPALNRVRDARESLSQYQAVLNDPDIVKAYLPDFQSPTGRTATGMRPKLGQLLVAAGLITLEELDAALLIQENTRSMHVPLGEILVVTGYLTEAQLAYFLRLQQLIKLPLDHPERWGQRLIELGLINEDQLQIALIDHQTMKLTLRQVLINRGWMTEEILDRIF